MAANIRKRLKLLLGDDSLVEKYVKEHGDEINITDIRNLKGQAETFTETDSGIGEDPVYTLTVTCPVCNNKNVTSYNLKAKSQKVEENLFLVPQYEGIGKYHKENFNLLKPIVCDRCYFVSPDIRDFTKKSEYTGHVTKSQLLVNPDFLSHLRDDTEERVAFVQASFPDAAEDPFKRPRSFSEAIAAMKLSIMRAEQEMDSGFPFSHYKIGNYHLQIAEIKRLAGSDNLDSIEAAADEFEEAFDGSDCPQTEVEVKSLYLLIATQICVGNKQRAGEHLKFFDEIVKELNDEMHGAKYKAKYKKLISSVEAWKGRAMNLWEYRDDAGFWKGG
ncbi:MAG: DUF2225 domain-containing protein [Fibrobacterota bacterium]